MGSSQSRMSKEKFKRKKEEEAQPEDSSSTAASKKLKLSDNSDTAGNVVEASDSEGCKDEVLVMKEKPAPASSSYSEGLVSILSSCLQCVVCGEYPRGRPLYSCPLHHHTCAECHQKPGLCRTCGGRVKEEEVSPLKRRLLMFVERKCCWHEEGCPHQAKLSSITSHEVSCPYQLVTCWHCSQSASLINFHHHSPDMTCFYKKKVFSSPVKVVISIKDTPAVAVTLGGDVFYLRVSHMRARSVWVVYLAAQLTLEDCSKYRTTLELSSLLQGGVSRLPGPPSSMTQSLEEVIKTGHYILVSESDMTNLSSPNGLFRLSCQITRNM